MTDIRTVEICRRYFKELGVYKTSDYNTFAEALFDIEDLDKTLYLDTIIDITETTTIPSNISIKALGGGGFTSSNASSLVINGPFECGNSQCFFGDVVVTFAEISCDYIYPEWTGCVGDGVTDDGPEFRITVEIARASNIPLKARNNYLLTTWTEKELSSNLIIFGDGMEKSSITGPNLTTNFLYIRDGADIRDIKISTFQRVLRGSPTTGATTPCELIRMDKVHVTNCKFAMHLVGANGENIESGVKDLIVTNSVFSEITGYAFEVFYKRIDNGLFHGNRFFDFSGSGSVVGIMFGYDVINVGDTGSPGHANRKSVRITCNHFEELNSTGANENQAIIIHEADQAIISGNTIKGLSNIHETSEDCEAIYIRSVRHALVQGNSISKIKAGEAIIDIKEYCDNAIVSDNEIDNSDYSTLYNSNGILCFIHNCKISGNKITNIGGMGINIVDYIDTDSCNITDNIIEYFGAWCGIFALCSTGSNISGNHVLYSGNLYNDNKNYGSITVTLNAGGYTNFVAGDVGKVLTCATANGVILEYDNTAKTVGLTKVIGEVFSGAITTTSGTGAGTFVSQSVSYYPCGIYIISPSTLKKYYKITNNSLLVDTSALYTLSYGVRVITGFQDSEIIGNIIAGVKTGLFIDSLDSTAIGPNFISATTADVTITSETYNQLNYYQGGIRFPSTQIPSSNINTLDDYKESTFTPAISFGGGTTGITYTTQTGVYTKIGRQVFFELQINLSSKGSSTGTMLVTGLPYTSSSACNSCTSFGYFVSFSGLGVLQGQVSNNASTIALYTGGAASCTALNDTNFTNSTRFYMSGSYFV